jgi:hypothetical protein
VPIRRKSIACPEAFKKTYHCLVAPDARPVLKTAREGNTPPKLHLVSTVDDGTKFPKNCRIILRYNRRAVPLWVTEARQLPFFGTKFVGFL